MRFVVGYVTEINTADGCRFFVRTVNSCKHAVPSLIDSTIKRNGYRRPPPYSSGSAPVRRINKIDRSNIGVEILYNISTGNNYVPYCGKSFGSRVFVLNKIKIRSPGRARKTKRTDGPGDLTYHGATLNNIKNLFVLSEHYNQRRI